MKPWENDSLAANDREVRANFADWFAQSKVLDKNGAPLLVYHGSLERDIDTFDTTRSTARGQGDEPGTYFTDSPGSASNYTRAPIGPDGKREKTPPGAVVAAYLSLQNPLDTTADIKRLTKKGLSFSEAKREALKKLDRNLHDGIVFWGNGANPGEFVAFRPEQIKSANNSGLYLKDSASISDKQAAADLAVAKTARAAAEMPAIVVHIGGHEERKKAKEWAKKIQDMFPRNPLDSRQSVMMLSEEDMVVFELTDSVLKMGAVEVKWFQAYPMRSGNGTKGMQELKRLAAEDGISLTLYPWDKGQISQAGLTKFYKKQGFEPMRKGGKDMICHPPGHAPEITPKKPRKAAP